VMNGRAKPCSKRSLMIKREHDGNEENEGERTNQRQREAKVMRAASARKS
jgi:hypothetical protein